MTPGSETSCVGPVGLQLVDGRLHVVGVEGAGHLERDDAGPGRRVGGEGREGVEGAGGDDLAGAVDVGRREAVARDAWRAPRRGRRRARRSCRSGWRRWPAAIARPRWRDEAHRVGLGEHAGRGGGGDLADRVAGEGAGAGGAAA